jgi:hypothetical protein
MGALHYFLRTPDDALRPDWKRGPDTSRQNLSSFLILIFNALGKKGVHFLMSPNRIFQKPIPKNIN